MDTPIPVIFVDDEPALRSTWEKLLGAHPGMVLVANLASAELLAEHVKRTGARLVLMDINLPGIDPLTAVADLARECPDCRVVMYSGHNDPDTVRRAYDAGAWGFVDKLDTVPSIFDVLRRVNAGEIAFPKALLGMP